MKPSAWPVAIALQGHLFAQPMSAQAPSAWAHDDGGPSSGGHGGGLRAWLFCDTVSG